METTTIRFDIKNVNASKEAILSLSLLDAINLGDGSVYTNGFFVKSVYPKVPVLLTAEELRLSALKNKQLSSMLLFGEGIVSKSINISLVSQSANGDTSYRNINSMVNIMQMQTSAVERNFGDGVTVNNIDISGIELGYELTVDLSFKNIPKEQSKPFYSHTQ